MGILDFSSDLARYRSSFSKEGSSKPEASIATNNKNFATVQPITSKLAEYSTVINKSKHVDYSKLMNTSKTDDIRKMNVSNILVNSVSEFSLNNVRGNSYGIATQSTTNILKNLPKVNKITTISKIDGSKIVLSKPSSTNDFKSTVDIRKSELTFVRNSNIDTTRDRQVIEKTSNVDIVPTSKFERVVNPNTKLGIVSATQTKPTPDVQKGIATPSGNVTNPNTRIGNKIVNIDYNSQAPSILKSTIKSGLVVNPNTKILKIEQGIIHTDTESKLSRVGKPISFKGKSNLLVDTSDLNLDKTIKTVPSGRNDKPHTKLGIVGTQQVDFFGNTKASGFTVNMSKNQTNFHGLSSLSWAGKSVNAPATNFITDVNGKGFTTFAKMNVTQYNVNSSKFGFILPKSVNYFDIAEQYAYTGFKTFVTQLDTAYKVNSSKYGFGGKKAPTVNYFDISSTYTTDGFTANVKLLNTAFKKDATSFSWKGSPKVAPTVDFFDKNSTYTTSGFTKFIQMGDTKYKLDSSNFVWHGNKDNAPEANYFDLTSANTTKGFHKFAQLYDTKFIVDSSRFDWDGTRQSAPEANYFDLTAKNTTKGFHKFAQLYDTKYVNESSVFDWDGNKQQAPEVNYFDLNTQFTTKGFHRFAQLYDTKYIAESSRFDWDGTRQQAPEVNYFDTSTNYQTQGFHKFAQIYDTKYIRGASRFDWDGDREDAPEVDFFDIRKFSQTRGFHKFARLYDTKYIPEASVFDWDGGKSQAPEVNYFDVSKKFTSKGFHRFAAKYDTKYIPESSEFDWDGSRQSAPEVNYFDIGKRYASKGFHRFAQLYDTKYIRDASIFDWDGSRNNAPVVNYFQNDKNKGFTKFVPMLATEYKRDVSPFVFKGQLPTPIDYFQNTNASGFTNKIQLHSSKYVKDSSGFVWAGGPDNAKSANYFVDTMARGFTKFAKSLITEYKLDSSRFTFKGTSQSAPNVDFLANKPADGFKTFALAQQTRFKRGVSKFTWEGTRTNAPEVNYFSIPGKNPQAIAGFTKLFDDKTNSKLSSEYSAFSFAGTNKKSKSTGKPFTNFFGYTPSERTGFMTNMTMFDGTLFPIIDPVLNFDYDGQRRYEIESAREQRKRLTTSNGSKFAPNSLGPRPWADGSLFATLENQVPSIGLDATPGSYFKKYERTMKDATNKLGYLTLWSITRHSPSPLDLQYEKYDLQNESYNPGLIWKQPFVVRGFQRNGMVDNERWGGFAGGFDDGIVRGGAVTQAERILYDEARIGKWLSSGKGLLWIARQQGLQMMNPVVDVDPNTPTSGILGLSSTLLFNPLSIIANVASARAGFHIARHGLISFDSNFLNKYEQATINRELNLRFLSPFARRFDSLETPNELSRQTTYNRLIGLMKELLPNSFQPNATFDNNVVIVPQTSLQSLVNYGLNAIRELTGKSGIVRISSEVGGPQSFLGVGGTQIRRAKHPFLTQYTTSPNLSLTNGANQNSFVVPSIPGTNLSQREPQYPESAKRDVFHAQNVTYKTQLLGNGGNDLFSTLKELSYNLNGAIESGDSRANVFPRGLQKPTLDRIKKLDPFDPKYNYPKDRVEAKTVDNSERVGSKLADGPSNQLVDSTNPVKQYRTTNYDGLKRNSRRGSKYFNDFRANIKLDDTTKAFIGNPDAARFDTRNLEERYGFGFQGDPNNQRDLPFMTNVLHKRFANDAVINNGNTTQDTFKDYGVGHTKKINGKETKFRGDRINIIDYKRANFNINKDLVYEKGQYTDGIKGTDDLIEFYFSSLVLSGHKNCPAEVIVFRATFGNITDNHQPSWNSVKYMGRADPLYVYQGYEREISFDFTVHISSRDEFKPTWRKLNYLSSWTAPEYLKSGQMRGPMIRLNIGHLYRKMPGYISSLSYTFDNTQTTWETAKLPEDMDMTNNDTAQLSKPGVLQLPKHINVNVSFVPVGVYRPEFRGVMYSLFDDSSVSQNGIENGLIPTTPKRVNYFSEFDDTDEPVIYSGTDIIKTGGDNFIGPQIPIRVGYGDTYKDSDGKVVDNSIQTLNVLSNKTE